MAPARWQAIIWTNDIFLLTHICLTRPQWVKIGGAQIHYWYQSDLVWNHWSRVPRIYLYVSKMTIFGLDNCLSFGQHQAVIWTNAGLIRTLAANFSEILSEISTFSFKKMHMKMSPTKMTDILSWPKCVEVVTTASHHKISWNLKAARSRFSFRFEIWQPFEQQYLGVNDEVYRPFSDCGQRGPYSPYKPCDHNLNIGISIFPQIDNTQSIGYN